MNTKEIRKYEWKNKLFMQLHTDCPPLHCDSSHIGEILVLLIGAIITLIPSIITLFILLDCKGLPAHRAGAVPEHIKEGWGVKQRIRRMGRMR